MGFLNLGSKDEYGRQRRIEHRGRHLRASRTGGLALRAQVKAAGVNLTANTTHGLRVSTTPLKGTQVGFQNGRFILRGRYGRGPTKLNVSKTGLSISTRNPIGTINWFKPNRSSARILGVQFRGKTAVYLQTIYGVVAAVILTVQLLIALMAGAMGLILYTAGLLHRLLGTIPEVWRLWRRRRRNAALDARVNALERVIGTEADALSTEGLAAALTLIVGVWGRGEPFQTALPALRDRLESERAFPVLSRARGALDEAAKTLVRWRSANTDGPHPEPALLGLLSRRAAARLPGETLPEILFEIDELTLAQGGRTARQARWIEVLGDFAGLRMQVAEPATEDGSASRGSVPGRIDLNRASIEALQELPHIGPERAEAITRIRPIRQMAELEAIDGIGPQRRAEIAEHATLD